MEGGRLWPRPDGEAEYLRRRDEDSDRLRLSLPQHRRGRRALVPQPGRAPGGAALDHLPDSEAVGRRGARYVIRDARRLPGERALHELRAAADLAAPALRPRGLLAPAPPRAEL